jgi:hypothetical protein
MSWLFSAPWRITASPTTSFASIACGCGVDELIHLSYRLRHVALQSAIGGMLLSGVGMGFAAFGVLTPVAGALAQEAIDVLAVLNALRTAGQPGSVDLVERAGDGGRRSPDARRRVRSLERVPGWGEPPGGEARKPRAGRRADQPGVSRQAAAHAMAAIADALTFHLGNQFDRSLQRRSPSSQIPPHVTDPVHTFEDVP